MPIDAAKAVAAEPRAGEIAWNHKDVQLYHLGVGAGANPDRPSPATDPDELRYTLESRLHVLPSFATVAGAGSPGVIGGLSMPGVEVDLARVLHGGQSIRLHRPIPVEGRATTTSRIAAVYDKGKAAILVMRTEVTDTEGPLWTNDAQIFVRGKAAGAATAAPPPASNHQQAPRTRPLIARSARTRPCSTGSPATGTRCTPTPSSPNSPGSTGRSCTGCARTG